MCRASRKPSKDPGPDIVLSPWRTMEAFTARWTQMAIQLFRCAPAGYSKAQRCKWEPFRPYSSEECRMHCGCNLGPLQQNIHNSLFSHIVSTKLNIDTTSHIRMLLEKLTVKWQKHSLPITKPIGLTYLIYPVVCQVNWVHDLFQIIYAKIPKQDSSFRVLLLISCLFHACYTPGQSCILICTLG